MSYPTLTVKQRSFIDHYIATLNGTEAAKRAGYKGSYSVMGVVAFDNLRKPKLRKIIDQRLEEAGITDPEIIARLSEHARGDLGDALEIDGSYTRISLDKLKRAGKTRLLKKFKQGKQGSEIEFYDAQAALVHLAKLKGLMAKHEEAGAPKVIAFVNVDVNKL